MVVPDLLATRKGVRAGSRRAVRALMGSGSVESRTVNRGPAPGAATRAMTSAARLEPPIPSRTTSRAPARAPSAHDATASRCVRSSPTGSSHPRRVDATVWWAGSACHRVGSRAQSCGRKPSRWNWIRWRVRVSGNRPGETCWLETDEGMDAPCERGTAEGERVSGAGRTPPPPSAAAGATLLRLGLVDDDGTALEIFPVELVDGLLALVPVGHLHEPEAAGFPGIHVRDDPRGLDLPRLGKELLQIGFRRLEREIPDVQFHPHVVSSYPRLRGSSQPPLSRAEKRKALDRPSPLSTTLPILP